MVEILAGIPRLLFDPPASPRGVLIFEPAVGVRDGHTVKNLGDRFDGS
jgi:hypothetical protein